MTVGIYGGALFGATRLEWGFANGVSIFASLLCPNLVSSLPWILVGAVVIALTLCALRIVSFGEEGFVSPVLEQEAAFKSFDSSALEASM